MPELDPIEQAFALFTRLRDMRTYRCDYRHTELAAFRMAVESIDQGALRTVDRPRTRKKPGCPGSTS